MTADQVWWELQGERNHAQQKKSDKIWWKRQLLKKNLELQTHTKKKSLGGRNVVIEIFADWGQNYPPMTSELCLFFKEILCGIAHLHFPSLLSIFRRATVPNHCLNHQPGLTKGMVSAVVNFLGWWTHRDISTCIINCQGQSSQGRIAWATSDFLPHNQLLRWLYHVLRRNC